MHKYLTNSNEHPMPGMVGIALLGLDGFDLKRSILMVH